MSGEIGLYGPHSLINEQTSFVLLLKSLTSKYYIEADFGSIIKNTVLIGDHHHLIYRLFSMGLNLMD